MAVTARMGWWQLDRAEQKHALQAAVTQQAQRPALQGAELSAESEQASAQWHRKVELQGRWLHRHTVFLDNRQMGGRPGFYVMTPLRLEDGRLLAVLRGWVPRDALDRTRLPELPRSEEVVSIRGRVAPWPSSLAQLGEEAPGPIQQNMTRERLQALVGEFLLPMSVLVISDGREGPLLTDWPQPAVDVHKHYNYAAQWFIFCAMAAGLYVWFQLVQPWRRRRR